ncbi:uncharacterized protein LOC144051724 [Vanacampus margaritifer]
MAGSFLPRLGCGIPSGLVRTLEEDHLQHFSSFLFQGWRARARTPSFTSQPGNGSTEPGGEKTRRQSVSAHDELVTSKKRSLFVNVRASGCAPITGRDFARLSLCTEALVRRSDFPAERTNTDMLSKIFTQSVIASSLAQIIHSVGLGGSEYV